VSLSNAGPDPSRDTVDAFLHLSIPELFAEHVARTPESVALVAGERSLTYRELGARADRLAHDLVVAGVRLDTFVALFVERSVEMIVGLLGILKAGGAYVPLDPGHPAERVALQLRETRAPIVLAQVNLRDRLPASAPRVIELAAYADAPLDPGPRAAAPGERPSPHHLAYCTWSSGSTGRPKGILVTQAGVVRLTQRANYATLGPDEVLLQAAPLAFDASTFEIWGALLNGGRLVLAPPGMLTMQDVAATVRRHGVTTMWLTAALFHRWCEGPLHELAGLRQLLAGGDVLRPEAVRIALRELPGCRLVNGYGPTETTTFAACHEIPRDFDGASVPLGRPLQATTIHLLDADLTPVADGEEGEICIGGPGLARGYLGDPEATAAKFVRGGDGGSERLYRSGDRGRRRPDGTLEFLGRIDRQVKIRGMRVEPAEVERALAGHPLVREALVLAQDDGAGDKHLVAYVAAPAAARPAPDALRTHLARGLPEAMIPTHWVLLDALPLLASGKVDVARLPRAQASREQAGVAYAAPRTPLEAQAAEAWAQVLGLERVGLDDRFRALGGSSIQAIAVAHRLAAAGPRGMRTPPPHGNVALREYAGHLQHLSAEALLSGHSPAPAADDARASHAQQQIWFLEQQSDDAWRAYRFQARFEFDGPLDVGALRAALDALVARHEILRTRFVVQGGELMRDVASEAVADLRIDDLSALAAAARPQALAALQAEERDHRFDIAAAPPVRWRLAVLAPTRHVLLQTEHHHLHDGQSFRILAGELAALYRARLEGTTADLPAIEAGYGAYCAEQHRWLRTPDFVRQRDAWVARLAGRAEDLRLFRDGAAAAAPTGAGGQLRLPLAADRLARIDAAASRHGVSRFAWMMAAWGALCARLARRRDIVLGSAFASRPGPAYRRTTGMFVNMVPVPLQADGNQGFEDFVAHVAGEVDFALAHAEVPLAEIVRGLPLPAALRGTVPFNVGFSFHDSLPLEAGFPGLAARVEEALPNGAPKFDLDVVVIAGNATRIEGAELLFEFDTGLFDPAAVERIAAGWLALLEATLADPSTPLARLPLLAPDERARVLQGWSGAGTPRPPGAGLAHELFDAQARRAPEALAARCDGRSLQYGELAARANRLAHRLLAAGVGPEVPVAVFVERGFDAIVALLAVLKAGGVYVPLDPSHPRERLALILEDCGARALLARRDHAARLPAHGARLVAIDEGDDPDAPSGDAGSAPPAVAIDPTQAAYCIHTSGSTGRPKGVLVSAGALASHLRACIEAYALTPADRVLQFAPASVDTALEQALAPLAAGAALVLRGGQAWSLEELAQVIGAEAVSVADIPTALWHAFAADGHAALRTLPLRLLIIGGEAALRRLRPVPALPYRVLNAYGPTEATITACLGEIGSGDSLDPGNPYEPLGRPLPGVRIHILDEQLAPVGAGIAGELCIGGAGLARGYLGRPELDVARFVADPFSTGGRLYRTGDLARWTPDGRIEFLGRVDAQLKVRGFRVEPGEVESALLACPGVREAAVVAREDDAGDRRLAAHVVAAPGAVLSLDALAAALRERLPEAMVPTAWCLHGALPRTPGGKIDRRALSAHAIEAPAADHALAAQAHAGPTLSAVLAIAAALMPEARIGADDDLIRLGMHSVLILRLVAQCREQLGASLKVREIYRLATPAAIAGRIEAAEVPS
jgi:amino acid adenylation domain-containing protein